MSKPSNEPDPDTNPDDGGDGGDDEPLPTSLNSMTKEQLLNYAAEKGITGVDGNMKKADILAKIKG